MHAPKSPLVDRPDNVVRVTSSTPDIASMNTTSSGTEAQPHAMADQAAQKIFSCVLCAQRKVKCDKRPGGCANCSKAHVPCIYKAPPPPRRRKKGERDVDTLTRIRIYEAALRELGVYPEDLLRQAGINGRSHDAVDTNTFIRERDPSHEEDEGNKHVEAGVLVSEAGKSRYLENGIWTSLQYEFRNSKEILDDSTDEESARDPQDITPLGDYSPAGTNLLFGSPTSTTGLRSLHPEPIQIFRLWQSYLDNVNPLVKLFHAPTVQQMISDASGNLDDIPRNLEALMFGIYCITVESLAEEECQSLFGLPKAVALRKFRAGAQNALINASLLKSSDLMVLQAFVLLTLSMQGSDARVIWIWTGIAERIGQRIGLHHDGAKLGLPPFEVEIRRRLWWQIMMLEGYTQKSAGTGSNGTLLMGDVEVPSNVNDSDLSPGMKSVPLEHKGPTEMMFFLIRCHVADFLKRSSSANTTFDGLWNKMTNFAGNMALKDKAIDELEKLNHDKFLQYCDPSRPWHMMCVKLGHAVICMMRFMAHSAGYYSIDMAQSEKDMLFNLALQVVASQNMGYTMKEIQGFIWHINLQFQWRAFVFILSELCQRTEGPEVGRAWEEVEKAYTFHPSLGKDLARRALPVALGNLTLKAWNVYSAAHGITGPSEPEFIQDLRRRRYQPKRSKQPQDEITEIAMETYDETGEIWANSTLMPDTKLADGLDWHSTNFANTGTTSTSNEELPLELPETIDWTAWDSLFVDFQTNQAEYEPPTMAALGL